MTTAVPKREGYKWNPVLLAGIVAATAVVFGITLFTPLGFIVWMFYAIPVGLSYRWATPKAPFLVAACCSVLIVSGFFLSPPGISPEIAAANRAMGTALLWAEAAILFALKRSESEHGQARASLLESERRIRNIFDQAGDGIYLISAENRYLDANPRGLEMLGYTREELMQKTVADVLAPPERPRLATESAEMMAGKPHLAEWEHLRKDGSTFPAEVSVRKLNDQTYFAMVRDLTQRKLSEARLKAQEHQLRLFVEYSPAAIAMFDREMRYLVASRRWLADYGIERKDIVGLSHYEVFPDLPERWKEIHRRCLAGAVESCEEDPFPRTDGTTDWVRWEVHPWRTAHGAIGGIIIFSELITERKRAAEALRRSEKKLRDLIDGLGPTMFVGLLTPEGVLIEANRPALEAAGLRPEDVIGKPLEDSYWLSYSEAVRQRVRQAITCAAAGQASRYDETIRAARDQFLVIDLSIQPLFDEAGQVRYLVPSAREITDRKHAEDGLRALAGQLLRAQDEERRRLAREMHDSMGQTVSAVALNLGELAEATPGPHSKATLAQTRELVGQLAREIRSLSYLLHPPLLEELGLVPAIRSYVRGFSERSGVQCHVDLPANLPRLPAEQELSLFRVLQESLGNLQRHSGSGRAHITLRQAPQGILLEIRDEGRGIPDTVLTGLQQGDTTGLGVGILGMRERLRQLGGSLSLESSGQGAVVRALLPHEREANA